MPDVYLEPCHHVQYYDPTPRKGDMVWCIRCDNYRIYMGKVAEWWVKCTHYGCAYSRHYGADEDSARRAAGTHARSMLHELELRFGGVLRDTIRFNQPTLPIVT